MKIDRVSSSVQAGPAARALLYEKMPWGWMLRRMSPVSARAAQRYMIEKEAWPGAEDARWSSRLLASLRNEGQIRLKFRV